ncbi:MAG: TolB-like 6-bladed beta-propeller domain-containing protein [Dysgonamonadaceae bacterium]|jgi:hypothetical protein|nr:TolB-like 6-bladed beta-propeller domain-containing protein [Dysgonamonadaceae bacterium]
MKITIKIAIFLIGIILCACTAEKKSDFLQHVTLLHGKAVNVDCLIGQPYEIVCIDTLLIFSDFYDHQTITMLDVRNDRFLGRFLPVGNGPGEVILPVRLFEASEKELGVFMPQWGCFYLLELPGMELREKIFFEDRPVTVKKTKDYYVGTGTFRPNGTNPSSQSDTDDRPDGRYHLYDSSGKLMHEAGEYPFIGKDDRMETGRKFALYQGYLCANPGSNFFAHGSEFCDNLEFFMTQKEQSRLLKKYETYDTTVEFREQRLTITDNTVKSYAWAYGTEQYCYFLYCGSTQAESIGKKLFKNHVIVFDWSGNHVKTFETDMNIQTFCIDEVNHVMYGFVTVEDEFVLMRFPFEI